MENKIIKLIYEKIKDVDLDEVSVNLYTNICNELVIDICFEHEIYTIHCFESYKDKESE